LREGWRLNSWIPGCRKSYERSERGHKKLLRMRGKCRCSRQVWGHLLYKAIGSFGHEVRERRILDYANEGMGSLRPRKAPLMWQRTTTTGKKGGKETSRWTSKDQTGGSGGRPQKKNTVEKKTTEPRL